MSELSPLWQQISTILTHYLNSWVSPRNYKYEVYIHNSSVSLCFICKLSAAGLANIIVHFHCLMSTILTIKYTIGIII